MICPSCNNIEGYYTEIENFSPGDEPEWSYSYCWQCDACEEFAQAIADNFVGESYHSGLYCIYCGEKYTVTLDKISGVFLDVPSHRYNCVVLKAEEYLKEEL